MELRRLASLTPETAERLQRLFSAEEWPYVTEDVDAGRLELLAVDGGKSLALVRIEHRPRELVVLAYQGCDVNTFAITIKRIARQSAIRSIRFHTRHRGLARLLADHDPAWVESVYRVTL